jgi:hypothetical protein
MSFSAAAAGNFQFFPSLGGGCQNALGNRRLGNFNFFLSVGGGGLKLFGSRRRRLENLKIFSVIGGGGWIFFVNISGGGGSAARLTPLIGAYFFIAQKFLQIFYPDRIYSQ